MNPLSTLVTTLEQELGLDSATAATSAAPHIETLQAVIMEGAIATYLSTVDPETGRVFIEWVESHQSDADLLTAVFEKFPELLFAVHTEMVAAIDGIKKNVAVQ